MAQTIISWSWTEAFDKFGFDDGDGPNFTGQVADFLESLGFDVECERWGIHNIIIRHLSYNGIDLLALPVDRDEYGDGRVPELGYDNPREYLRPGLVAALDRQFDY